MYLYQCYVTDPWWQCDDLVPVKKGVKKAWNPDSQNITIYTDSEAGSWEDLDVEFYAGGYTGDVYIVFGTEIRYWIGYCSTHLTSFPATLPTETEKIWTITYNYTEERLVLHCNGVLVADVVLSNACDRSDWGDTWGTKPTQIEFESDIDTASDIYCFSSNPGKYNGVIDSGE